MAANRTMLRATDILAFRRDGNRRRYETPYFGAARRWQW